ncbi:Caffeyl-CoA reductase-Etf complex subunit CarE [Fusobacterium sp. DD29]|uniref:electron transfer flavoprotein subunit alpha/FixB family protein n=1 Tax=unclassified Fusobacterium TaxID=2648384 RepID=UPI001B8C223B|nr:MULTISPECIES: electron transfer flavoprotein subunit alpha/FixB family protein [unclassified Fusobacterium]MBR8701086.1 Caffeyl-CoA reductase-Etf complex subunit CarE [Fusobacterium sp. DD45]MBR8710892.1 Caffeyl-CoA reductase-Etf complex subunit CarE [Fusobacterium sp. DD28]MBR8748545.1 Caffeyl-CoA reductase-Etf complex subunit CarE [Fusobacterium sp. DD29]MBR8751494.1 Caffeyl-CoA reductase-Etf complex subunit CarE [Fusobacterium sp. DD26]MBR8760812.1 Caffeyl-CoA reductase-Etf complex subun
MKLTDTKNIMVYVETKDGAPVSVALESLAEARTLADETNEEVLAVVIGKKDDNGIKTIIEAGADKVIIVEEDSYLFEKYAGILKELVKKYKPSLFMAGATLIAKDLTPAIAKEFETSSAVDVLNVRRDGDKLVITCPVYGGTVLNDIIINTTPVIMTVRPGSFSKNIVAGRNGEVIEEKITVPEEAVFSKIIDIIKEVAETVNLEEADVIVSGGRGMGSKENFQLVQELADVCGGVVGATRPAIEDEWVPRSHQVGQSGKIVAPKLYIACGISGATQHVSGMIGSGYIVAINKDEDAAIFDIADVGIVGDAMKVIPLLIEEIKKVKA